MSNNTSHIIAALTLTLALTLPAPAFAQSFLGTWKASATVADTEVYETLTVTKADKGYVITAKLAEALPPGMPEAGPGTDIMLDGDNFIYKRTATSAGGALVVTYSGVVSGDSFTGVADLGFGKVPYHGVRIKPAK